MQSLWEANMDLLKEDSELKLFERKWKIYSVNPNQPPQFISSDAQVHDSLVNEGCVVYGNVSHSVLFKVLLSVSMRLSHRRSLCRM